MPTSARVCVLAAFAILIIAAWTVPDSKWSGILPTFTGLVGLMVGKHTVPLGTTCASRGVLLRLDRRSGNDGNGIDAPVQRDFTDTHVTTTSGNFGASENSPAQDWTKAV